jgi:hypothetical protein
MEYNFKIGLFEQQRRNFPKATMGKYLSIPFTGTTWTPILVQSDL